MKAILSLLDGTMKELEISVYAFDLPNTLEIPRPVENLTFSMTPSQEVVSNVVIDRFRLARMDSFSRIPIYVQIP